MIHDLVKIKEMVEQVLLGDERARNEDAYLMLCVWERCGLVIPYTVKKAIINDMPSSESIRRTRQKFQEEGQYLGVERRKNLAEEKRVREWSKGTFFEGEK